MSVRAWREYKKTTNQIWFSIIQLIDVSRFENIINIISSHKLCLIAKSIRKIGIYRFSW